MSNWDYCKLSHLAKEHGGPKNLISDIKFASFQEGRESMEGWMIEGSVATIALGIITFKNIYDKVTENNRIKTRGKEAEEKLLMCINKNDTEGKEKVVTKNNQNREIIDKYEEVNV